MNSVMFSSKTDLHPTPQAFYDALHAEFNFTLDPCASPDNAKCQHYYTREDDGLKQSWGGANRIHESALWARDWSLDA